jgi:hypothetical protein
MAVENIKAIPIFFPLFNFNLPNNGIGKTKINTSKATAILELTICQISKFRHLNATEKPQPSPM